MNRNQNFRRNSGTGTRIPPAERAQFEAFIRKKRAAEARRAAQEQARIKAEQKKRRKENARVFRGRLIIFLIVLVLVIAVAFTALMIHFRRTPDSPDSVGKITYYYGGAETRIAPPAECAAAGGIYLCFNDLSDYLGMAESGSARQMKFVFPVDGSTTATANGTGKEEYVVFYSDATKVSINGQDVTLEIPNVIHGEEIWVSKSFVENYMNGLSVAYNQKKGTVTVARIKDDERSTESETVYADVSFRLKPSSPISPVEEDPLHGEVVFNGEGAYELNFTADLSEYEEFMNPEGDKRDAFLTLVNTDNTLTAKDVPDDLVDVKYTSASKQTQQMRLYAYKALEALFEEMHALGYYDMAVYSGYRSYSYQETLFEQYVSNEMAANPSLTRGDAEKLVLTYATRPGTSEHQTGLAVDMDTMGAFTTDFQYTEEYQWLSENAWKFGFVLRFPAEKTDITTIQFEPWHYRYVGRYHAMKMHESGLCLEEYVKKIK